MCAHVRVHILGNAEILVHINSKYYSLVVYTQGLMGAQNYLKLLQHVYSIKYCSSGKHTYMYLTTL